MYWLYKYKILSVCWKIINKSELVGISEAIRLILILVHRTTKLNIINLINNTFIEYYAQSYKLIFILIYIGVYNTLFYNTKNVLYILNTYTGLSTKAIIDKPSKYKKDKHLSFNQWLAGLIDGDGYFLLTKKGFTCFEITMDIRDIKALYEIKLKYGGRIKPISNANAVRYKLRHKKGLVSLLSDINGLIRNPTRLLQMNKLCSKYNIKLNYPLPLTFNNAWLSGFIDSDGSVYYSEKSGQIFISLTQKNKYLLDPLIAIYGGRIDILSPKIEGFKYIIYRKTELFNLINNYFINYPLKTEKMKRVNIIKEFFY